MTKFPKSLGHSHHPDSIEERLAANRQPSLVRDFIFGGMDGIVTTFSIIAGVVGAGLANNTIIILGAANILADGFSMAASNYLGTKSEHDEKKLITLFELDQIHNHPEGEKEEICQIFRKKGLKGEVLEEAVNAVIQDREQWLKLMLSEEWGISHELRSPWKAGLVTFVSFFIFGLIPLVPFLFNMDQGFTLAIWASGIAFFALGAFKSLWSVEPFWISGLKTLFIGAVAAGMAYGAGILLKNYGV